MRCVRLCILVAAAQIRVDAGEDLEEILGAWTALSGEDKEYIRAAALGEEGDAG